MSHRDIAKILGTTYQNVQYIERMALAKIKERAPWLIDYWNDLRDYNQKTKFKGNEDNFE
jgi:transcriptional regulator